MYINPLTVLGAFVYCCEFAGEACAERRDGTIWDDEGQPATLEWMAESAGLPKDAFEQSMELLTHKQVRWIEEIDTSAVLNGFNRSKSVQSGSKRFKSRRDEDEDEDEDEDRERDRDEDEEREPSSLSSSDHGPRGGDGQHSSSSSLGGASFSDSLKLHQITALQLSQIFSGARSKTQSKADRTTFGDIIDQLVHSQEEADRVLALARDSQSGKYPIRMFIAAAKRHGYKPKGRR